ncbi:recombinase family protein [Paenibacillus sp. Marseille-Q4541]|uniref:recombinase family protein n=1 Tax=Paenibacillus sp. Marseille-Q4541 TaxID=2831522 RepID=UPI001BA856AB|nr:recombinase family protein [Paenibacillus sp. Marseille-Q4541]
MEYDIKDVALYLRKSRGEEETDLDKHRHILVELCEQSGWRYIEYSEIGNSETIEYRPKFKQLLKDLEDNMFDAVAVVDYDRLGRGDLEDQALIKRVFRDSETFIITPEKIYNLVDDSDDLMVDVKGLLARQEYKAIKKRLTRGKKLGARQGKWTNGIPPFPYVYDPSRKGLVVDSESHETYKLMKQLFLNGESLQRISFHLNNLGIPSPKGSTWHDNSIRRILIDETHLGKIITNKVEGSAHKNKKTKDLKYFNKDEWIVIENCHEKVKTPEEHQEIISKIKVRNKFAPAARRGAFILSGLVKCGYCGYGMQIQGKNQKQDLIKPCNKPDPYGNRCSNRGNKVETIIRALLIELEQRKFELEEEVSTPQSLINYDKLIDTTIKKIEKVNKAIKRIKELYEEGEYEKEEYQERMDDRKLELNKLQSDLTDYEILKSKQEAMNNEERIKRYQSAINVLKNPDLDAETKNKVLKEVIDKIVYYKKNTGDNPKIEVTYK